jgi:hypothetical protein
MGKFRRFFSEAGTLGMGGVIFAFVFWGIAAEEHVRDKSVPAFWFLVGGCAAFCFGCFMAWAKADDRANERKPKLGFSADRQGFYLTHLEGESARFIEVNPLIKPSGTKLHFDPVDFLGGKERIDLIFRLELIPQGEKCLSDMGRVLGVMFSAHSRERASYPITIRFRWNQDCLEEKVMLTWDSRDRRFETKPQ